MKKLAIIGASYLQEPLIRKARDMGIETHVFAWAANDVGERSADFFYPISIVEKENILTKCREIGVDGVCSIGSDLAVPTVNYIAENMKLVGNSVECVRFSTNKYYMRRCFEENGDPSPKNVLVDSIEDLKGISLVYPIIVKPIDRSGSRGITKLESKERVFLEDAIAYAKEQGFDKHVLVEEFVAGQEYSVECISWEGIHCFLAMTKKFTTGKPHFIETAQLEPASVSKDMLDKVKKVVFHALDSLHIVNGASHAEIKMSDNGEITIIEIGSRMGGDCIGSHLVEWSTGIDFVRAVIQIALGEKPDLKVYSDSSAAAIRYIFSKKDLRVLEKIKLEHPEYLKEEVIWRKINGQVTDSSTRFGYYLLKARMLEELTPYLPKIQEE